MTEAPDRIWATINGSRVSTYSPPFLIGGWESRSRKIEREVEYVRADLFDAVKAERDDELLNIARQAGYQDGAEDRRKLEARVKALAEALVWCSGSSDFNEGGQARVGWLKLCAPLIESE